MLQEDKREAMTTTQSIARPGSPVYTEEFLRKAIDNEKAMLQQDAENKNKMAAEALENSIKANVAVQDALRKMKTAEAQAKQAQEQAEEAGTILIAVMRDAEHCADVAANAASIARATQRATTNVGVASIAPLNSPPPPLSFADSQALYRAIKKGLEEVSKSVRDKERKRKSREEEELEELEADLYI
jgi:hypothetical protein